MDDQHSHGCTATVQSAKIQMSGLVLI
jgi:hypothetical protein